MTLQLSLVPIVFLLGAGQGAFLALMLFTRRSDCREANVYLGALALLFTVALMDFFCDLTGLTTQYPVIQTVTWPREFFFGPLLYFYTRELTQPGAAPLQGRQWLHFLPGFVHVALSWLMALLSPERQAAIFHGLEGLSAPDHQFARLFNDIEPPVSMAHVIVYLVMALIRVRQHRSRVAQHFSYTEQVNLTWLRNLLAGLMVVYVCWLVDEFLSEGAEWLADVLGLSIVVLIYAMAYRGLQQPAIFGRQPVAPAADTEPVAEAAPAPKAKYQNSSLSPELSGALLAQLQHHMQQEKPYLDNTLSLPELAASVGLSVNHLSQCINEQLQQNFFDFVNGYRIEAAKSCLLDGERQRDTILTVAMDSGFNSKSAFYSAFKKHTGMTPSQFRRQHP